MYLYAWLVTSILTLLNRPWVNNLLYSIRKDKKFFFLLSSVTFNNGSTASPSEWSQQNLAEKRDKLSPDGYYTQPTRTSKND